MSKEVEFFQPIEQPERVAVPGTDRVATIYHSTGGSKEQAAPEADESEMDELVSEALDVASRELPSQTLKFY